MERTLLWALCLLLALAGASLGDQKGEECRAWTYGPASTVLPFQCPKRLDGADARFCCGPCRSPFCCAAEEARLDQKQCLRALRRLDALPDAPEEGTSLPARQELKMVTKDQDPGEETSLPPRQDQATLPSGHGARGDEASPSTGRPRTTRPRTSTKPQTHGFIWVLLGIAAVTAVCCAIFKFCPNPQECYTYLRYGQFTPPSPPSVHYNVQPPSPAAVRFDIGPPPYEKEDGLPPYYLRNPFDSLAHSPAQDSAGLMELGVTNPGYQAGEAATVPSMTRVDSSASGSTGESAGTGEVAAKQVTSCSGEVATQLVPSETGEVAAQLLPSGAGEVATQLVPSGAGEVATQLVPSGAGEAATHLVLSATGEVAAQLVPSGAGEVATQLVPSGAGEVATQLVPSGAGKAATHLVLSATGEVAAQLLPAAEGAVIFPPEPTRKRRPGSAGVYWESKESEV